jgi:mRNA-degrading endonuclease toxin of MazEF toxin-antitoxin module
MKALCLISQNLGGKANAARPSASCLWRLYCGVILSDQIKSLDWTKRDIKFIVKSKDKEMTEVVSKINVLINI